MLSVRQKKGAVSSSQDLEDILSPYDYANRNDADNFCPVAGSIESDDDHHDAGMTFGDQTDLFSQNSQNDLTKQTGQFTGDNLVVAPNMVRVPHTHYLALFLAAGVDVVTVEGAPRWLFLVVSRRRSYYPPIHWLVIIIVLI